MSQVDYVDVICLRWTMWTCYVSSKLCGRAMSQVDYVDVLCLK